MRSLSRPGSVLIVLSLAFAGIALAQAPEPETPYAACIVPAHTQQSPPAKLYGAWESVIPADGGAAIHRILGMQTVHTAMLPSGKILLVSGSSWRNLGPIQTYPEFPNPTTPGGIFKRGDEPFRLSQLDWYYQLVNNAAVYDPDADDDTPQKYAHGTFYRIPSPTPVLDPNNPNHFAPNDLFCTGQQHLPDGNVLFTGGTQYYYPFRTGNNSTWIFDWRKELTIDWKKVDWRQPPEAPAKPSTPSPWMFAGFMERGRWYASLVPLLDGRMAIFSGFVGFDKGYNHGEMYMFEINHIVEFFDPRKFDPADPKKAWHAIDVKALPNSPYTKLINPNFKPTPQYDSPEYCPERCKEDNKYDAFKLYPENYLMADGRLYLTREGDWVSLRTCDTAFMRKTKVTYWATIGNRDNPSIAFAPGPDRAEEITSYGTSLRDPNTGRIEILGGQQTSAGIELPLNSEEPTHFAGGRGSRKMESLFLSPSEPGGGHWTLDPNFLGSDPQDDRTMHYSVILPTRQILIVNGGNYDFYGPVFYPLLLTPNFDTADKRHFVSYTKTRMVDAVEPRNYHNAALLLPDARVFVSGGNTARATVRTALIPPPDPHQTVQPKPDLSLVDVDNYFFGDGPIGRGEKGMLTSPTENWTAEIFTPPYLFIDGPRAKIHELKPVTPPAGYDPSAKIGGKTIYLVHSKQTYSVQLEDLSSACTQTASLVLIKLPSATHGWENGQQFVDLKFHTVAGKSEIEFETPDAKAANIPPAFYMLFYVDCNGKPSKAKMVRFDDEAKAP